MPFHRALRPRRVGPCIGVLVAAAIQCLPAQTRASVSLAVTWDALVRGSSAAAVVTPVESRAVWEGGRICTYTRVRVERTIAGDLADGADAWVRTFGGVVGNIGQRVDGEAVFAPGRASLVFLRPGPVGALDVTARGQGQFPIVADADPARPPHVVRSNAAGLLLVPAASTGGRPRALAAEVLDGRLIDDAAREVVTTWRTAHAR